MLYVFIYVILIRVEGLEFGGFHSKWSSGVLAVSRLSIL